jgi:hypothetical protein
MMNTRGTKNRNVDEDILAAVVRLNKAKALVVIEPFHRAADFGCRGRIGVAAGRAGLVEARRRRALGGARRVDLQHARDLRTLDAVADINFQFGARRDGIITCILQSADMEKRIARAIAEFDEAKPFVALEPFDDRVDGSAASGRRRCHVGAATKTTAAERRPRMSTRARGIIRHGTVVIESAFLRPAKIVTFAHEMPVLNFQIWTCRVVQRRSAGPVAPRMIQTRQKPSAKSTRPKCAI